MPHGANIPDCTWHCPLVSLPHVLGTELTTVPAKIPYVRVPPGASEVWDTFLRYWIAHRSGLGRRTNPQMGSRPLIATTFVAGATRRDRRADIVLAQKGAAAEQASDPPAGLKLVNLSARLYDFAETAAAIANLDLVITTCTAVAHLAGALGKPVWLMLAHVANWMWLIGREDSPWYPTARLFRQPALGAWDAVIEHIAGELRRLVEEIAAFSTLKPLKPMIFTMGIGAPTEAMLSVVACGPLSPPVYRTTAHIHNAASLRWPGYWARCCVTNPAAGDERARFSLVFRWSAGRPVRLRTHAGYSAAIRTARCRVLGERQRCAWQTAHARVAGG